jgi:hypothetical protein
LKIELTETEIIHIMDALGERVNDLREAHSLSGDMEIIDLAEELEELSDDLREASARNDDGWNDRNNDVVPDAAAEFIQAGIDAREQVKASSRAEARRNERMMSGTASPVANDPIDW